MKGFRIIRQTGELVETQYLTEKGTWTYFEGLAQVFTLPRKMVLVILKGVSEGNYRHVYSTEEVE
jgi:hypothetical protein